MNHYYFDANPLVSWADSLVDAPAKLDARVSMRVVELISGGDATATSAVTMLEMHTVMCNQWRDTERPAFDEAWVDRAFDGLNRWVENGDLLVLSFSPRIFELAMANVEIVTRNLGRKLRGWDAAHLCQAVEWARELGEPVTLVTTDSDYAKLMPEMPEFEEFITLLDPTDGV